MAGIDEIFGNEKPTEKTFNKEEWAIQKEQSRALAYQMLGDATEELNNPDTLMSYLDIQSKFDRYSVSNAILVAYQCPEASVIHEPKTWRKQNVYIQKGESAIIILEPGKEYERKDGTKAVPYNAKKVFDISQTNAKKRAQTARKPDARLICLELKKTSPVDIEINNELPEGVNAQYSPKDKKIFIRQGLDAQDIVRNLVREMAYAKLDKGDFNRDKLRMKAEAIAYIVCKRVGFEPEPIKTMDDKFLKLDVKDKRKELSTIRDNANGISLAVTKALEAKHKEKSRDSR